MYTAIGKFLKDYGDADICGIASCNNYYDKTVYTIRLSDLNSFNTTKSVGEIIVDPLFESGGEIPFDGVVIEVNDLNYTGRQFNQYNSRQCALKFKQWSFKVFRGVIEDIVIEQRRVFKSVRVKIHPSL